MNNIDDILRALRTTELPEKLVHIDGALLADVARGRRDEARKVNLIAATIALFVGFAGSALPAVPASAAVVTPFGVATPLAPSTLLASQP